MEKTIFDVLFTVSCVHRPQGSSLLFTVIGTAFGIAVSLLNSGRLWKLRPRKGPRANFGKIIFHHQVTKMAWDFRLILTALLFFLCRSKQYVKTICQ